jgi:hypothetical protein
LNEQAIINVDEIQQSAMIAVEGERYNRNFNAIQVDHRQLSQPAQLTMARRRRLTSSSKGQLQ